MRERYRMERVQVENSATQSDDPDQAIPGHSALPRGGEAAERSVSWKIEIVVDDSGEWESDPLRFETPDEALAYARDLEFRCAAVRDRRVVKSQDPVNRNWPQNRKL
jgi:hypothetical protein